MVRIKSEVKHQEYEISSSKRKVLLRKIKSKKCFLKKGLQTFVLPMKWAGSFD